MTLIQPRSQSYCAHRRVWALNLFLYWYVMQLIQSDWSVVSTTLPETLSRSSYTLLYFYPKNDTPGCTLEAQDFTKLQAEFAKKWIQIVWVSKDDSDSHCKFVAKYELSPSYISDPDLLLHKKYGAWWEKNNYGKIVTWVIRSTFLLDSDWQELHSWKNVKATWHAQRVLDWVDQNMS